MKTLNPQWNETIIINISQELLEQKTPSIEISCWDYNTISKPSFMGLKILKLSQFENEMKCKFETKLDQVEKGKINFEVTAHNFPEEFEFDDQQRKEIIREKLKKHSNFGTFFHSHSEKEKKMFNRIVNDLSSVSNFQKEYLSTNWTSTLQLKKTIEEEFNEEDVVFEEIDEENEIHEEISREKFFYHSTHFWIAIIELLNKMSK
jgi:Ca2+-dependent lipid-binding protein